MSVTARPYAGPPDLENLNTFLIEARRHIHEVHYLHVGDLVWGVFHMQAERNPADIIQLWEDPTGRVLGFVLLAPAFGFFELQLQAHQRGGALEQAMMTWAETHLDVLQPARAEGYATFVHERDRPRIALLERHGYSRGGAWRYLQRSLDAPIPTVGLPAGFSVRHVQDAREAPARARVLAAAFGAQAQPERYQQFMQAPGYTRELDVVAVAPDGQFGAFALCWVDPMNKVGQFEPVGTDPAFRRLGLGRAVLYEGMRRMRAHGAEEVIVIVEEAEQAALALYEAVGLKPCWQLYVYSKARS